MRRQTFNESSDAPAEHPSADRSLACRVPGCKYRWAVDISHGKVCSMHDDIFSRSSATKGPGKALPAPMQAVGQWWKAAQPTRDPEPHWQDDRGPA